MKLTHEEIKKLKELNTDALILFGSQAQNLATKRSDYDFLVLGQKKQVVYDGLYDLISEKINRLVNIDIVFDEDAPMELKMHAVKYGKILYQKNARIFPDFKQHTMTIYQDFAYYRQIYQKATLDRIS